MLTIPSVKSAPAIFGREESMKIRSATNFAVANEDMFTHILLLAQFLSVAFAANDEASHLECIHNQIVQEVFSVVVPQTYGRQF